MAFTVVPLHNLVLPSGSRAQFGESFILQELPPWVPESQFLKLLSHHDRESIRQAQYALFTQYEAESIGQPDPEQRTGGKKTIQDRKFTAVLFANFALWLVQPSNVCFTTVLHGLHLESLDAGQSSIIQQSERQNPLYCHPEDCKNTISFEQVVEAGKLHEKLISIPRDNPVWRAMRLFWAGLTSYAPDLRYSLFWIGLEALFGPKDNSGEISYKLSQRIAFFVSDKPDAARDTFRKARDCYNMRSKIIHGRWEGGHKIEAAMADTEAMVRQVVVRLLNDAEMLKTFLSEQRDGFLEDWVFSRSTEGPSPKNQSVSSSAR
jgi:Apea-like HEPN